MRGENDMVKNLKVIGVETISGEEHYVVTSYMVDERKDDAMDFDEVKIKGKMKKEASKPLRLMRAE